MFLRPQENVTLDAGQNPGATKIPLPLQAGDKNLPSGLEDCREQQRTLV